VILANPAKYAGLCLQWAKLFQHKKSCREFPHGSPFRKDYPRTPYTTPTEKPEGLDLILPPERFPIMSTKQIQIRNWKPMQKNTLRGFFTLELPSGMVIHNVMLQEKGDSRWITFPSKEYTDRAGQKQFDRFIEFTDRNIADRFRDLVLAALDDHFQEAMNASRK